MLRVDLIVPEELNFRQVDQTSFLGRCRVVADFDAEPLETTLWDSEVRIVLKFTKLDIREADQVAHLIMSWAAFDFYGYINFAGARANNFLLH